MKGSLGFKSHLPYTIMVLCNFAYAGMALFSKAAISRGMNPYVFGVYRQAFATVAMVPFAYFCERKSSAPLSFWLLCKMFFVSLCGITLCLNMYNLSMSYIPATFVSATANAIPAITFVMAVLFRMESLNIKRIDGIAKVLGSAICITGALVFTFVKGPPLHSSSNQRDLPDPSLGCRSKEECIKGTFIVLLAHTAWALWMVLQAPIVKQYPDKLRLTTIQCFFSVIQSGIWAIAVDRDLSSWKLGWDQNLIAVAYSGVIFTGLTYWLRVWVIQKKGPVFAAIFTPLALLMTAIFSAFMWHESLGWGSLFGALLLVGGLYGYLWGKHKEAKVDSFELPTETKEAKGSTFEVPTETKANSVELPKDAKVENV